MTSAVRNGRSPRVLACCGDMVSVFGLERMSFEVLRVLRERGADVHCIVNGWESHRIRALAARIGASTSTGYYEYGVQGLGWNPIRFLRVLWGVLRTSAGAIRAATRFRATHVFVPDFVTALRNAPALILFRLRSAPVILRVGTAPARTPKHEWLWRRVVGPLVDRVVCNSRFLHRELGAVGIPAAKLGVARNTLAKRREPGEQHGERDWNRIVFVGQVIPDKGLHVLLDAMGLLVRDGLDVRLDVVGRVKGWEHPSWRGYWEQLHHRAEQHDLAGRVRFLGYRDDVLSVMGACGLHCCPSLPAIREGFGTVALEAKHASLPSVVTRVGGLPELVQHREDGWICDEPSGEALAEGLSWFLSDPARLKRASKQAYASLAPFSAARFATRWWEALTNPPGDWANGEEAE